MDLKEAIYTRRSTRDYTAEPVSEKIIRELIDAAIQAPTAVNAQPLYGAMIVKCFIVKVTFGRFPISLFDLWPTISSSRPAFLVRRAQ